MGGQADKAAAEGGRRSRRVIIAARWQEDKSDKLIRHPSQMAKDVVWADPKAVRRCGNLLR